ncbi:MAG: autoinducer binding domain-containing protein [Salibaculum sp.]|jgi:LuxR family transcriptional regulator|uniref:helix-turn-helix transcriptional regulator n=1 Tax=Salibaculum sp. TaxID=2855480 RepID=UPI00287037B0|nr:autoinducer binding domain-containing protein [Salibaculum sp.]MDR9428734.1 autoinducer binding domain-containing protein [Salibaculum sp.]MDR9483121.1 autoinducer binding domain-containing protein [Salibaculum sp.]
MTHQNQEQPPDSVLAPASAGYYIALRVGFAFPLEEVNALPRAWVDHYTQNRFMLHDPVIRWIYSNTGAIRWSALDLPDPMRVLEQAQVFGLRYGAAVACYDGNREGQRSFGTFVRGDREFTDAEIAQFECYVDQLHRTKAPPTNLTPAEIEALGMIKRGMRLKQVAHELGVTEGAIKQRLKNAKTKLNAQTSAQAAAMACEFGLI